MSEERRLQEFNFRLDWAGARFGFSEITGLDQQATLVARRNNDSKSAANEKVGGFNKSLTITLNRGVFQSDSDFNRWLDDVKNQNPANRTTLTVSQFDEQRHVVAAWTVVRCYPTKVVSPSLNATGNEVAIESLEIEHEGFSPVTTAPETRLDGPMEPQFTAEFPVEQLKTGKKWPDLKLHSSAVRQLREIEQWTRHNDLDTSASNVASGYRALFYGSSASDRTVAAALLGTHAKRDVYRVDLSQLISKYIGETEKNLSRLFDRAEENRCILFIDEADALLGKRTEVKDAHDRYTNQEVLYLLERIENYGGLLILSANDRPNTDERFVQRLQAVVHFPKER